MIQLPKFLLCLLLLNPAAMADDQEEWTSLFDGKTFNGWTTMKGKPVTNGWKVVDGAMHRASAGGDIITEAKFKDFILEFEWKISEGGNSGVKYRVQGATGIEYQVLDDQKHADSKNPTHRAASFYDLLAAPDSKPIKPVGEWNQARIVAKGPKLEHWLNGTLVAELDQSSDDWKTRFESSKYKKVENFGTPASPILLQDHRDPVWFRNLRIKELK
ncbi:3-keto-disaccharide hydrolase [Haloferula rosea]|uniref:DUF1080 domain-containing protein n=1 Tax=Haloferula rosea TaxID=490093 RepID=A0A934RF04_9BACT|nr:DUF1080 domain-containing protein [Haloferula rosea]MBK1827190.1 DUF1080 domain-containing protein [Haloferula rosea]